MSRRSRSLAVVAVAVTMIMIIPSTAAAPPEVTHLGWCAGGAKDCLTWTSLGNVQHRVYQGDRSTVSSLLNGNVDSCLVRIWNDASTTGPAQITELPASGNFFWYLVVGKDCAGEGSSGDATAGARVRDGGDCNPASCFDGLHNGSESSVDCGGECPACPHGQLCCLGAECVSASCSAGTCAAPNCSDSVRNGSETDVDCGGGDCPGCADNLLCNVGQDCQSQVCGVSGTCSAPTCSDAVRNGQETDTDCGGGTCLLCGLGALCAAGSDCASGFCSNGACDAGSCTPPASAAGASESATMDSTGGAIWPAAPSTTCGTSGNTYWSWPASGVPSMALDGSHVYVTAGSRVSKFPYASPVGEEFRDMTGITLGRPLVFDRTASPSLLVTAGSDGFVYGLATTTLQTLWSRNLRRASCTTDTISAPPVVQRWADSDPTYRAARSMDTVIAGTAYACSTTTANKVYGIDANNGNILWTFNNAGTNQVDAIHGLVLDPGRNRVYVVSQKSDPARSQNTVWALNSITGARIWSVDVGSVVTEPALANGGLYVGTSEVTQDGVLYKLDPETGATLWQRSVPGSLRVAHVVGDEAHDRVYAVTAASDGTLHAFADACSSATPLWTVRPSNQPVSSPPTVLDYEGTHVLYVGTTSGRVWQINALTGAPMSYATAASSSVTTQLVFFEGPDLRLLSGGGTTMKKLCIPWDTSASDKALHLRGPRESHVASVGGVKVGRLLAGLLSPR